MKPEDAKAAQQGVLVALSAAFKLAPHPLLKAAAVLLGAAAHLKLGTLVPPEAKPVEGTATRPSEATVENKP